LLLPRWPVPRAPTVDDPTIHPRLLAIAPVGARKPDEVTLLDSLFTDGAPDGTSTIVARWAVLASSVMVYTGAVLLGSGKERSGWVRDVDGAIWRDGDGIASAVDGVGASLGRAGVVGVVRDWCRIGWCDHEQAGVQILVDAREQAR
jgi:hypothetical protein